MLGCRHGYRRLSAMMRSGGMVSVSVSVSVRRKTSDASGAFADRARLVATGGHGGAGCVSFARGPNKEVAPPDGGNGGDGGSVWLEACDSSLTLRMSTTRKRARAGGAGMSSKRKGRNGADLTVRVPAGTVAYLLDNEGAPGMLIADLDRVGKSACVARGGRGGRGNVTYKASTFRSPEKHTRGAPGEVTNLLLELKTIADVGLVGFPNAGKSTLLRAVSNAKPRVAAYAFTTLRPHIGVVQRDERRMTLADIPGIIDGAHMDRGLGHEFLRHIERARALLYVVDVVNAELPPADALAVLEDELELYQRGLSKRVAAVVANKMDAGPQALEALARLHEVVGDRFEIFPTSAKGGTGVVQLVDRLFDVVEAAQLADKKTAAMTQTQTQTVGTKDEVVEEMEMWRWESRNTGEYNVERGG